MLILLDYKTTTYFNTKMLIKVKIYIFFISTERILKRSLTLHKTNSQANRFYFVVMVHAKKTTQRS